MARLTFTIPERKQMTPEEIAREEAIKAARLKAFDELRELEDKLGWSD